MTEGNNEGHGNLSPEMNAWLKYLTESEGFAVNKRKRGDMFTATTRSGSKYTFVVTNPEKNEVAMESPENRKSQLHEPQLVVVGGATAGGSMIRVGWVGIGSFLQVYFLTGGFLTITPLQFISLKQDGKEAERIMKTAEAKRPREMTEQDLKDMDKKIKEMVKIRFPATKVAAVNNLINFFCFEGRSIMLNLLIKSHEAGNLDKAFSILAKQIREHWQYKPPEIRGAMITGSDLYQIQSAYEELGLPIPR